MIKRVALCTVAILFTAGCQMESSPVPSQPVSSSFTLPDPKLTPGAISGTDISQICPHVNPALEAARPSQTIKNQVYAEYGITSHTSGEYEIDHLVPISLLGDPSNIRDLWPEPNDHPKPGILNSKDILELKLHTLVCQGKVPLAEAQHAIQTNWIDAFNKYIGGQ